MDEMAEPAVSTSGLPTLPPRDPPTGRHYLLPLARIQVELADLLAPARAGAAQRLAELRAANADEAEIATAYHELAFLRHANGPLFQAALLVELGHGKIRAMVQGEQDPLARVRELSAAIIVALNTYPRGAIEQAGLHVHKPLDPEDAGSENDRRAALFLANSPAANRRTAGLIAPQRLLDAMIASMREDDGRDQRTVQAEIEAARQSIAARIRAGEVITARTRRADLDGVPDQAATTTAANAA